MSNGLTGNGISQSSRNTGRANLEKAEFFAAHVEDIQDDDSPDIEQAEAYLDAAIVFGKATQDWIKDQYGLPWLKRSRLWNDPVCKFFADMRDVVVHEDGSVRAISRTHVTAYTRPAVILVSGNVAVMQSNPTDCSLLIRLWTRLLHGLEKARARRLQRELERARRQRLAQLRGEAEAQAGSHPEKREQERARRQRLAQLRGEAGAQPGSHPESGQITRFHFLHDDPRIAAPPALRVVNDYLDLLEAVLVEAQDSHLKPLH